MKIKKSSKIRKVSKKRFRKSLSRKKVSKKRSRKSLSRRKVGKYLYDGMERSDIPSIKLEKYIKDIKLFYQKSFNDTISSFKMFMYNNKQNDTFEFIKELFNFHRERQVNEYYHNKSTILGLIIISGLYDEFENLIDSIRIIKRGGISESKSSNDDIVNCDTRRDNNFKGILIQHRELTEEQQDYLNKIFKINKLDSFVEKIKVNKHVRKEFVKSSDLKNEIKKFLYYSVCIERNIRRFIMRHYLLHFIKSAKFLKYKEIITLNKSSSNKDNALLINRFLLELESGFRQIRYMEIEYVKKDGQTYSFNTCGETTILNLLNYYFIKENGTFNIKDTYSTELKDFYKKYDTMTKQLENQEATNKDWLNVVSNLRKKDEDVRLYNERGDIHNNISNINFVLKTILNSEKSHIINILDSVNEEYTIYILEENENSIKFILNDTLLIFFKPGHGEMIYQTDENYTIEDEIEDESSDFYILYESIFIHIDEEDRETFIREKFEELSEQWEDTPDILKEFLNFNIISYQVYSPVKFKHLNKLENLQRLSIEYVRSDIPISIYELTKLKNLTILRCGMTTLPEDISKLSNLEELVINNNDITTLPNSIGNLSKLKILNLYDNKINKLPDSIGNLSKLEILNLTTNKLEYIPDSIGNLKNLETLSIMNNKLRELPESIGNLSNLKKLYLYPHNLKSIPKSIRKLKLLDASY